MAKQLYRQTECDVNPLTDMYEYHKSHIAFVKSHNHLLRISNRVWTKDVRNRTEKRGKRKKGEHFITKMDRYRAFAVFISKLTVLPCS